MSRPCSSSRGALVVVLHGCGQSAAGYDVGSGWSTLAKHYGLRAAASGTAAVEQRQYLLQLVQSRRLSRAERGEACSIRQMIARMVADHGIDPHRIFVTGLSAGGAMTTVMLATYPELFCAGARHRGACRSASRPNVREALSGMRASRARYRGRVGRSGAQGFQSTREHGRKLSVWHGSADRTVYSRQCQ